MANIIDPSPSSAEKHVLVIGAAGIDLVGQIKGDLSLGSSTPAQIRSSFGGVARNVAENLARLGQPVKLLSAVGLDSAGDRMLQHTSAAGVDVSEVLRSPNFATGTYLAVIDHNGKRQFALDDMRAIGTLTPEYIHSQAALFGQASLLFIDANLPKDTLRTVMSLARQAGLPVCADPTSASLAPKPRPYLPRLYLTTPNSTEAGILCEREFDSARPRQAIEAAKCLVSSGVEIAIITLAQFGVCYATSQTSGHIPAIRTQILDPTGAGDALTATVLFALLNDIPLDDAVRLGVAAASLTLRYPGAVMPELSLEMLYERL